MPHTFLPGRRIPRDELAAVAARAGVADDDRADVRLARLVLHLDAFVVHAEIVGRARRSRFVFGENATGCWFLPPIADGQMSLVFFDADVRFSGILDRPAGLEVDAGRPVDVDERLGHQQFAGRRDRARRRSRCGRSSTSTLRVWPLTLRSTSTFSLMPS